MDKLPHGFYLLKGSEQREPKRDYVSASFLSPYFQPWFFGFLFDVLAHGIWDRTNSIGVDAFHLTDWFALAMEYFPPGTPTQALGTLCLLHDPLLHRYHLLSAHRNRAWC